MGAKGPREIAAELKYACGKAGGKRKEMNELKRKMRSQKGIGVVETILILVVLIALVVIFKSELTTLVTDIFENISSGVKDVTGVQ